MNGAKRVVKVPKMGNIDSVGVQRCHKEVIDICLIIRKQKGSYIYE